MRSWLVVMLLLILVLMPIVALAPDSEAVVSAQEGSCAYAAYHPGFAIACFWEIYLDMGGGFNYGDGGDADDIG